MSEEKYQANDRSSFSYSCKAPSSETDKRKPISGVYSGFFFMKTLTDPVRVAEKSVNLKFSIPKPQTDQATAPASNIFKVEGHGRNAYGSFKLSGEYTDQGEGKGGSMILMKQYVLSATTPKARSRSKKKTPASSARKKTLKNYVSPHITSYRRSKTGKKTQLMYLKGEIIRPAEGAPASFTIAGKWAMTKKDFEGGIVSDFRYVSRPNSRSVAYQSLDADQSKMTKGGPATPGPSSGAKSEMPSAKKISDILEEDDASMSSLISEEYRPLIKQMTGLYDGHFCMMAQDGKIEKYEEQGLFFFVSTKSRMLLLAARTILALHPSTHSHIVPSVSEGRTVFGANTKCWDLWISELEPSSSRSTTYRSPLRRRRRLRDQQRRPSLKKRRMATYLVRDLPQVPLDVPNVCERHPRRCSRFRRRKSSSIVY